MLSKIREILFGRRRPQLKSTEANQTLTHLDSASFRHRLGQGERDFSRVMLRNANLRGLDLSHVTFVDSDLSDCDLTGACLINANLSGCNLERINGAGALLTTANLYSASLRGANLSRAVLRYVNLTHADLSETNLTWADLRGAIFNGTLYTPISLSWANLDQTGLLLKSNAQLPRTVRLPSTVFRSLKRRSEVAQRSRRSTLKGEGTES